MVAQTHARYTKIMGKPNESSILEPVEEWDVFLKTLTWEEHWEFRIQLDIYAFMIGIEKGVVLVRINIGHVEGLFQKIYHIMARYLTSISF